MTWIAALVAGVSALIPKVVEDVYTHLTTDTPKKKYKPQCRIIYTKPQMVIILTMWKSWQENKSLYKNQHEFTKVVNAKFNTTKTTNTLIALIKKSS